MGAAAQVLKNFNLSVDGRGYAGQVEEVTLPALVLKLEEMRMGGMDAPLGIDMGMEKLECGFVLVNYDINILSLFGLVAGTDTGLTFRGGLENTDGTVTPMLVAIRGRLNKLDPGKVKAGDKSGLTGEVSCSYLSITVGGVNTVTIDIPNMVRMIGGVDQLALIRAAIGL